MYGSVVAKSDCEFRADGQAYGNYVLRTSSISEVDSEGYLAVSKSRLSIDESEEDRIYEEIKA